MSTGSSQPNSPTVTAALGSRLHTHVAISNKVRGRDPTDHPWLALDGRPIFKSNVAASEFYNTRIEAYSVELTGLVYAERTAPERGACGP